MIAPRFTTLVLWVCMLTLNTASQLAMKLAANGLQTQTFGFAWLQMAALSPFMWLALFCEGINFALWLAILKRHTLSMAFSVSSLTYALILVTSWALLHEIVQPLQAVGTALILSGIILMGQSAPTKNAGEV